VPVISRHKPLTRGFQLTDCSKSITGSNPSARTARYTVASPPREQSIDVVEPSPALDLIYVPQPKAEHTAVREELPIREERRQNSAKSLFPRPHLRREGDGFRCQVSRRGRSAHVVIIEVEVARQCYPMARHYGRDLVLKIAEEGNVADFRLGCSLVLRSSRISAPYRNQGWHHSPSFIVTPGGNRETKI
jgi:hypothetical protein